LKNIKDPEIGKDNFLTRINDIIMLQFIKVFLLKSFFLIDSHQSLAPVTLVRLGPAPAAQAAPAPAPEGITTRRSTRSAAKFGGAQPNVGVEGDDEMSSVQVTVDSQELALVTQQANPILLLDQDQVRDYIIVNYSTVFPPRKCYEISLTVQGLPYFSDPRIVKTAISKFAHNEDRH
jgi:hypothetical protein